MTVGKREHNGQSGFPALGVENDLLRASTAWMAGVSRYTTDFFLPYLISTNYFNRVEGERLADHVRPETAQAFSELLLFNLNLAARSVDGLLKAFGAYTRLTDGGADLIRAFQTQDWKALEAITARQAKLLETVAYRYPQAIEDIEPEFGFHFERPRSGVQVAETDRFIVYQVKPTNGRQVKKDGKPVLIIPPYVLGANILAFLPGEDRSYTHCFANQGIPTYIRVLKDIRTSEGLQLMTGDDDARDTRLFCQKIKARHGRSVTLNGYCQGGFNGLCDILSGELDGLVDAFITCVSPMDGTRSKGLAHFLNTLPQRFNDLAYGTKILPNGNAVADGILMGWVYKLKSIDTESPLPAFYRDLMMFARQKTGELQISKTAAALNYWLNHERFDLPLGITRMSFASYNTPIASDGTLPVKLFGRKLNLKRLQEKKIPWLICYGEHDDLVEKETALAPLDFVDAEVTAFPKGHVAIATSWSDPNSAYALHTRFADGTRGPVRFQLDLEKGEAVKGKAQRHRGTKAQSGKSAVAEVKEAAVPKAVKGEAQRHKGTKAQSGKSAVPEVKEAAVPKGKAQRGKGTKAQSGKSVVPKAEGKAQGGKGTRAQSEKRAAGRGKVASTPRIKRVK